MSKRYPGNSITGNPVALSQTSNNGIWDLKDNYTAVGNDTWQAAGSGTYEIPRSLRIRNSSPAYLTRTPATAGNRRIWTRSFWVKRGASGDGTSGFHYFTYNAGASSQEVLDFYTNSIRVYFSGGTYLLETTQKFRDYSAWYHIVVAVDTTQASAANRVKLYVNGSQITTWTTFTTVPQNFDCNTNNTVAHTIGYNGASNYFDGYMAEMYLIDGQQLDASYFGYVDPINSIWQPKKYTGAYGNNGFYLPFSENFSTTNLGRNFAGSNHFTYSQAGTDASYVYNNASGTANFTTAPDGTLTATKLTIDSSNTSHRFYKQYTVLTSGAVAVVSAYVKALPGSVYNIVALENWTGSAGGQAYFNLSTGQPQYAAAWPAGSGFQYVGDGWYRIWTTFANATSNGTGSPSIGIYMVDNSNGLTYTGNGTAGFYFWGVQANLGTTPDNYIATTSAASINNFTPSGISVTAGTTYDSMVDSPTNIFTTATDIGGVVSGNYATWNVLTGGATTYTEGNLRALSANATAPYNIETSIKTPSSGKFYVEVTVAKGAANPAIGIGSNTLDDYACWRCNGTMINSISGLSNTGGTGTWTTGDVIGMAYDIDGKVLTFYKNNVSAATFTNVPQTGWSFIVRKDSTSGDGGYLNCGQRPFAYTPPAGFKSFNTTNIQACGTSAVGSAGLNPGKYFDISLYSGNSSTTGNKIGGLNFAPDLVWIKHRSALIDHSIYDTSRGAGRRLSSSTTAIENNYESQMTSFNSDGFTVATTNNEVNEAGKPYVAWQWKQSPTSGFNIVPYTGTGVARSISHNLGVAPSMMIVKGRDGTADNWRVYHKNLTSAAYHVILNSTLGQSDIAGAEPWNDTAPTSSVFTIGTDVSVNQNTKNFIAYLWAEVPGFSKFGSYTGNGSADGPFIYTGFRPRFFLAKVSSGVTGGWHLIDTSRSPYNEVGVALYPNSSQVESSDFASDILSNGIKMRNTQSELNGSGNTYIYAAFAESPFALNNRAR